jgi:hypothetical protein
MLCPTAGVHQFFGSITAGLYESSHGGPPSPQENLAGTWCWTHSHYPRRSAIKAYRREVEIDDGLGILRNPIIAESWSRLEPMKAILLRRSGDPVGDDMILVGIVNLSRGGILLPWVARRSGAEKSLARL